MMSQHTKDVLTRTDDTVDTSKVGRKIVRLDVPGPKARALISRDAQVISPSYPRDYGFVMAYGRGCEVFDVDGNRFLDFAAGVAVNSTGHCHPHVVQAIKQQLDRFIHISSDYYHELWIQLAEKLDEIAPFEEDAMSFMTNSGTEAIEAAIKLARYYTGRHRFIGFLGAFHGRTMGSLAFNGSKVSHRSGFFGTMPDVVHIPFPDPYRPVLAMQPDDEDYGETVVNYIEQVIFQRLVPPDEVAAVLVEPILGEGGYIVPANSFFPRLRALCDRYGILLIVDEVQSGMGRTGAWWAIEHWDVEPDIVCTAKGIASGMPLGAAIARRRLMTWPPGSHGNTYGGNPLACAAALTTIEIIEKEGLRNAQEQGDYALRVLREMAARHPSLGDVRGKGLMIGIELVKDKATRQPAQALRDRTVHLAFEHGLLVLGCGTSAIRIAPPLIISRAEMTEGLQILDYVLTRAEEELL